MNLILGPDIVRQLACWQVRWDWCTIAYDSINGSIDDYCVYFMGNEL